MKLWSSESSTKVIEIQIVNPPEYSLGNAFIGLITLLLTSFTELLTESGLPIVTYGDI